MTPLHYACLVGKKKVVEMLLKYPLDVHLTNVDSLTAIELAKQQGKDQISAMIDDFTRKA